MDDLSMELNSVTITYLTWMKMKQFPVAVAEALINDQREDTLVITS